jgi:hypothetical protein
MPSKSMAGAKKKHVMKDVALKEVAAKVAAAKPTASKAISGRHATRGKQAHVPVMAAPVSAASTSTSAPSSVSTGALSAVTDTPTCPTVEEDQAAEIIILRGEYMLTTCACDDSRRIMYVVSLTFLFFSADSIDGG